MGNIVPMDTVSQLVNGRTYLPIRAVLEAFDANVTWSNGCLLYTSAFMLAYYLAFATDVPKEDTMTYPRILIDQEAVLTNAAALKKMGEQQRIQITPVVKA